MRALPHAHTPGPGSIEFVRGGGGAVGNFVGAADGAVVGVGAADGAAVGVGGAFVGGCVGGGAIHISPKFIHD